MYLARNYDERFGHLPDAWQALYWKKWNCSFTLFAFNRKLFCFPLFMFHFPCSFFFSLFFVCVCKYSICLPMEARDSLDIAYLVAIMAINGLAFCIIAICYARMYFSLDKETRHAVSQVSRGEMTVAKKMALLVFTNFACWAPIAFFGLTELAGLPLIDVAKSKILLVFFYPLNSCADPYLYAILTSQYRRDLFVLLSK